MTAKKNEEQLFDLRTLQSLTTRGIIKPPDYEKYLKSLPDDAENHDFVNAEEDPDQNDEPDPEKPNLPE